MTLKLDGFFFFCMANYISFDKLCLISVLYVPNMPVCLVQEAIVKIECA
jgi:hypothetical protein